ncbi:MAG: ABC transporter transmembrane domain-containing protein, partial [Lachnospiraceae bacterium]
MEAKKRSKMAWLWENMKGYRAIYIVGILGTIVYNVMQLTVPYFTQRIIDLFLTGEEAAANLVNKRGVFFQLIIAMIVLTFVRTLIVYLVCMDVEYVSQKVLYRIRVHLFDKIERQDMQFYNTYRTGDLMTRVTGDLDAVRHMIAWVIRSIVEAFALLFATAAYFFYMDWRLAISILAIAPFIMVIIVLFRNKVAPRHKALREKLS